MALPSGYTPLEYIESTGSQYVDTGFKPNQDTRVVIDTQMTASGTQFLFGTRGGASESYNKSYSVMLNASGSFRSDLNGSNVVFGSLSITDRWTVDKNKNVCQIGNLSVTNTVSTFQSLYSLFLFAVNEGGAASYFAKMESSGGKVYDDGTLIRNFLPCTNPSGEVGLYDDVNGVFYGDAAGVGFVAGPVAAQPEAPASLELIGTTRNAAILAWPGAPVGQSYRLYRDGVVAYEGSNLCYTDAGLAAGSAHIYSVHTVIGSTESEGVTTEATTTEGIVLITDRTAADVAAGRPKGFYNALDLIRVGEAVLYVQSILNGKTGFNVSVSAKTDWQLDDIPTRAQLNTYLENIRRIHSIVQEYLTTATIPGNMDSLTWKEANAIESILIDAETLMHDIMLSNHNYSGRTISGVLTLP